MRFPRIVRRQIPIHTSSFPAALLPKVPTLPALLQRRRALQMYPHGALYRRGVHCPALVQRALPVRLALFPSLSRASLTPNLRGI